MSHPSNVVSALATIENTITNLQNVRSRIRSDDDQESCDALITASIEGICDFLLTHAHNSKKNTVESIRNSLTTILRASGSAILSDQPLAMSQSLKTTQVDLTKTLTSLNK